MTQQKAVELHLKQVGSISTFEAFTDYGITRLSAVIHVLRHSKGMEIVGEPNYAVNRFGNKVRFFKYKIQDND